MRNLRRYSGNDKHWGPFTLSKHSDSCWRPVGIMLDSGGDNEDGGSKGCNLKLHALGHTLILELPRIIPDFRIKHIPEWDAATIARLGRNYYYEVFPREFGFTISDGNVHVHYGPQTWDSKTTKSKVYWIPWMNWRFIRKTAYDTCGAHFWTEWSQRRGDPFRNSWLATKAVEDACPTEIFEFDDYDGKRIRATTKIEEREWRLGIGWFRWLSLFRAPKIKRCLDLSFSEEVGPEKGSWKGGTVGHSIEMLPNEMHEEAFRRYCEQDHRSKYRNYRIAYVGKVAREQREGAEKAIS